MRNADKESILQLLQTVHKVHREIKKQIEDKEFTIAKDLLSQCQEAAISVGNIIEETEGENCITVSYLEEYCELLYQAYERLEDSIYEKHITMIAEKITKKLKKQMICIENSVKQDIPVRREVVFFPYKASMWDSLESVYLEAKADPNCDAYCVPIPYFDRNSDGSLGQMHYEGAEYPENIEITDWQTYHFEERRPDAIYIHNPYDEGNYVTCVHPRFFSSNLKKYTDELVYIPYFVLDEIDPNNQAAIDGMKHFIWTSGVIFADKVILQSENMRQIYINEYLKEAKENGLTGAHIDRKALEQKFLGTGSPKFDKVDRTRKEALEIPEEWKRIIYRPDGSRKKIILYNNSITALLKHEEQMLEKMKHVFQIFYENREKVALLWRPHPLIETTVKAMRPQLWEQYRELRDKYLAEGWGIYDDSADLDRAIAMSDAYYGDRSSVVQLYRKTRKPVMIQDANVRAKYKRRTGGIESGKEEPVINAACASETEQGIWFIHAFLNILMFYDFFEKKVIKARVIPNDENLNSYSYSGFWTMLENDNKLYLFSDLANACYIYDISEDKFVKLDIKDLSIHNFIGAYKRENYIYVIPYRYDVVVKINLNNDTVTYSSGVKELYQTEKNLFINYSSRIDSNQIVVAIPYTKSFLIFNMKDETWKKIKILEEQSEFSSIIFYNQELYALDFLNTRLIKLDLDGKIKKCSENIGFDAYLYGIDKGYFIVDEITGSRVRIYNSNLECIKELTFNIIQSSLSTAYGHCCWIKSKDKIYGITKSNELIIIDKEMLITIEPMAMDFCIWKKLSSEYVEQYKYLEENEFTNLNVFMDSI